MKGKALQNARLKRALTLCNLALISGHLADVNNVWHGDKNAAARVLAATVLLKDALTIQGEIP